MQLAGLIGMVLVTLCTRSFTGTWLHPSSMFNVTWTVTFAVASLGRLPHAPAASVMILIAMIGAASASTMAIRPAEIRPGRIVVGPLCVPVVLGGSLAGVASAFVVLYANGFPVSAGLRLGDLLAASSDLTARRYQGNLTSPTIATLMLAWLYGAAILAPFAAFNAKGLSKATLLCAPGLGGAYYAMATTAKSGFLVAVALTAGSWVMTVAIRAGGLPKLRARSVLGVVIALGAVFASFVYFTANRRGGFTPGNRQLVLDEVLTYAGGSVPAFEQWLNDPSSDTSIRFGAKTFSGISKYIVADPNLDRPVQDLRSLNGLPVTNVYSVLRPLTEDFSVPGAVLALSLGSLAAAFLYRRAVLRRDIGAALIVAVWLGSTFLFVSTSITTFTSVLAAIAAAYWLAKREVTIVDWPPEVDRAPTAVGEFGAGSSQYARIDRH